MNLNQRKLTIYSPQAFICACDNYMKHISMVDILLMTILSSLLRPSFAFMPLHTSSFLCRKRTSFCRLFSINTIEWSARKDCWRPDVNDVERISWGKPSRKKGTGSRGVPHRLNEEERTLFDLARSKGFLEVAGSGWRSQRRDSPLVNSYRSLCDARAQVCLVLNKGPSGLDQISLDLSPLRTPSLFHGIAAECLAEFSTFEGRVEQEGGEAEQTEKKENEETQWKDRPIYQLPPFCVVWELPRSDAKIMGKSLSSIFSTAEGKKAPSKKPIGLRPGKNRRNGGYGIG